jgi:hypothetical protein
MNLQVDLINSQEVVIIRGILRMVLGILCCQRNAIRIKIDKNKNSNRLSQLG